MVSVVVKLKIVKYGSEMSWSFNGPTECNGEDFSGTGWNERTCYVVPGDYNLRCIDSYGDGWHGGKMRILGVDYCKGFTSGKLATGGPITITYDSGTVIHGIYIYIYLLNHYFLSIGFTYAVDEEKPFKLAKYLNFRITGM